MRFTIFTPTYNRAYIIENLYRSLLRQTFRDFEWVVIDDGSTDNTKELFNSFLNDDNRFFELKYKKVENGGKHRAINSGVKMAAGELFFIVDSDDYLSDNALEIANNIENSIPNNTKNYYAGICGLRGYSSNNIIGTTFNGDFLDITSLERGKHNITGDKSEIFYTNVLKKYPFPEFDGENFITECVVWDKIAYNGYKLRFFNKIIYICDYLTDGLTAQSDELFNKTPKGYGLYLYQCGLFGKTFGVNKWLTYLKYYYQFRDRLSFKQIANNLNIPPVIFKFRIIGMQIFYRLYDN